MNIYFSASIRGGREDSKLYQDLISFLSTKGGVLTHRHGNQNLAFFGEGEGQTLKQQIVARNMNWLKKADIFIAETTIPSLGVGYGIANNEFVNTFR